MKLDFLKSTRFWGLCIIAIVGVLNTEGILPQIITNAIITIIAGYIGIRSWDRTADKLADKIEGTK